MKFIFYFLFFLFLETNSFSQTVKTINYHQIEKRIEKGQDTLYVVNFWATWCAPCVKELPYFEKLAETYKGKPLKVLLVSLDFKNKLEKDLIPFVKKHQLKAEVLLNENLDEKFINQVSKEWSGALPATLFISVNKQVKAFYEKEFTFEELNDITIKLL